MEPITIGVLAFLGGSVLGGAGGYVFGSAAKAARYDELMSRIHKQALLIAEQEKRITELILEIQKIRETRTTFQRFLWFVFKSDPQLYRAFGKMEQALKDKGEADSAQGADLQTLIEEFPGHPNVELLRKVRAR